MTEWIRAALAAAVLFAPAVASGNPAGRDPSAERAAAERAGRQLEQVIEHYQNGELEHAWEAYRTFFDNPANEKVSFRTFVRCFFPGGCPSLGALAYILGKSEADAGDFREFCPDWSHLKNKRGGLSAEEAAETYERMLAFRAYAFGGSCDEWAKRNAAMFEPRPKPGGRKPQILPITLRPKDSVPVTEAEILQTRITGELDTGATMLVLNNRWADAASGTFELIQNVPVIFIRSTHTVPLGRTSDIRLGNEVFLRPVALAYQRYWVESGERIAAEEDNVLGMNLILQYESACFDWEGRKLHLGDLGPCKDGSAPYRSWLTASQGIAIEARSSSNDWCHAKIDTGSDTTWCSEWFMERTELDHSFSFGSDSALRAQCDYDPDILFPSAEPAEEPLDNHVLLGMDALSRFAAFGWELNPLKVYFVPKPSGPGGDSPTPPASQRQAADEQGGANATP